MDVRRQRVLQDTMTAIRHGLPLADCGAHLFRNGERHLRTRTALGNIYGPALMQAAESCRYPRLVELTLLEAGYTVRLHEKKITKTETRKDMRK